MPAYTTCLLNPRDTAFTVPRSTRWCAPPASAIACLVEPVRYDPDSFLTDPRLRARTAALDAVQRAALAEALTGNMGIHIAYCVRADAPDAPPRWDDPDSVPALREMDGAAVARNLPRDGTLPVAFDRLRVPLPLPRLAAAILQRVDGRRSFGAIADELAANGVPREAFWRDLAALRRTMESMNRLLLAAR